MHASSRTRGRHTRSAKANRSTDNTQPNPTRRRQKGTGQWFLAAPEFATWLGEPKDTLFCPGIPGAGKTIVAAIAIDHLVKSVQSSLVGVAYVYCNYKAQEEQDAFSMLAAIVKQLVQVRSSTAEPVERLYKQHADRGTKPSLEEIFSALREVVSRKVPYCLYCDRCSGRVSRQRRHSPPVSSQTPRPAGRTRCSPFNHLTVYTQSRS
ncbi:hypothetical protein P3342_005171 [Pyrenophora teres f. teres]|nr:hypothetical protein P3342_005171 [Pyrenophora teres f. teres]